MAAIESLLTEAKQKISATDNSEVLNAIRVEFLGKKGRLTSLLKNIGQLPAAERPKAGQVINQAKQTIAELIQEKQQTFAAQQLQSKLTKDSVDVTLPGRRQSLGNSHPISIAMQRCIAYFKQLGFMVADGPEIEDEYHNFTALNIPEYHPARAMQDTFYLEKNWLLRTHTSPVQIRIMKDIKPPIKMIAPGRVYRCDSDVTHTPMFHQIEGLVVDEFSSFADLKGILQAFIAYFFERELKLRFRPSYFPFTEPSAEVDIECVNCRGKGCRVCKQTGWLEVLGCGMVHPNVLENVGYDADKYQGYAFGMGIDRFAMLRYQIDDLRILFENDLRFLSQF
ncbi:MAG: phenylalanine--tRNA ligase subunit alpha [Pseudomonadota bacterium]